MLSLNNVALSFGGREIFKSINLTIQERERVGLVGRNGSGKSTLLKIIAGQQSYDQGSLNQAGNTTIGFLHQDIEILGNKSVIDELLTAKSEIIEMENQIEKYNQEIGERTDYESDSYMQLLTDMAQATEQFHLVGGHTIKADGERILGGLGFKSSDMDRSIQEFSGGWQMRVELAKILFQNPSLLLLDEPTNHLDIESIMWLENFLKSYEGSVIVISHDRMFLDAITNRTAEIELGNLYDYKANYTKFKTLQKERREKLASTFENQQKEIEHKQKLIDKFRAKANKAKMAQSLIKQLDKMELVELEDEANKTMRIRFQEAPRSGEIAFQVENGAKHYGDLEVFNKVDFKIERGERVAFVGQNGQGKTTLAKVIAGVLELTEGKAELGYNVELAYYAQNQTDNLDLKATILETLENNSPAEMRPKLRGILGSFLFSGEDVEKKVTVLSGGEKARVALACLLLRPMNLLILDEPTNHLDLASKEVLKEALKSYDGSLIVVSHDRDFLDGLTERTLEFRDGSLYNHLGDINYFLEKRKAENMRKIEMRSKQSNQLVADNKTGNTKAELYKIQKLEKSTKRAESKIEKLEASISEMEARMSEFDFYESPESADYIANYEKAKVDLEEANASWERLYEELEGMKV